MIEICNICIAHKDEMDELMRERDEYYTYKILAEMRQDDTRRQLEEALEAIKNSD